MASYKSKNQSIEKWLKNFTPIRFSISAKPIKKGLRKNSGRFNFSNFDQNINKQSMSLDEAYKILNLDPGKKYTKDDILKSYKKIMKKIHPDINPELNRLASIVNEAKDIIVKQIS